MTMQVPDEIIINDNRYYLYTDYLDSYLQKKIEKFRYKGSGYYQLNMVSCCWRGYIAQYAITNNTLSVLKILDYDIGVCLDDFHNHTKISNILLFLKAIIY